MKCLNPTILETKMLLMRCKDDPTFLLWLHKKSNGSIAVPCGQCYLCRKKLAREQTLMISKEIKNWPENERFFITFTYRNANLPYKNGRFNWWKLENDKKKLIKKLQNKNRFWKNGKRYQKKMLYYLAFEKSSTTMRPHFHMIICGFKINDLVFHKIEKGNDLYVSKKISKIWQWGHHEIGKLDAGSAAYVTGYVMKKIDKNYDYRLQKWEPSKRTVWKWQSPGWGLKWALTNIDTVKNNAKYHTKYWVKKIKEKIIKEKGNQAWLKYLKYHINPDKKSFGEKWEYWYKWSLAWKNEAKIKRNDKI